MAMCHTQMLMSVMLIMENVSTSVPTLMAVITVLVIMDINLFKMIPSIVLVCKVKPRAQMNSDFGIRIFSNSN